MSNLILLFVALIAGVIMAVQGSLNSALSKVIGLLEATFIVHITGTLIVVIALFILKLGRGNLANLADAPWYTWLGGILGILIVYGVMFSIPKLGVSVATTAIIAGQVFTACLIDHFGMFGLDKAPFTWWKLLGIALLASGAKLLLR